MFKSEVKVSACISGILISVLVVAFLALINTVSADDSVVSDVAITVPVSCNITDTLDQAHSATINPGQYKEDIGTTTFKVFCNDNTGYSIYAIGYSNEEYGNTNLLPTNTSNPSIVTGTATSGDTSNWAMKLIPTEGTYKPAIENGYSSYKQVPDTYTKVATFTQNTDFTIGSELKTTYSAYIQNKQPADTYNGKVKYTLVHPNDADAPEVPITLADSYAKAGKEKLNGYYKLQDMSSTICSTANVLDEGSEMQAIDTRDNKVYWITKLRDGKCWFTQNLDHDINPSFAYTHDNTDLGYGISTATSWTPDKSTYATGDLSWCTTGGGCRDSSGSEISSDDDGDYIQQSYDPGNKIWNGVLDETGETNPSVQLAGLCQKAAT